jgi:PAS domain S-box-containing protein
MPLTALPETEVNALAALMQQSTIGVAVTDGDGRYLMCNRCWSEMLGYDIHELLGMTVYQVTHPDSLQALEENAAARAAGAKQFFNYKKYVRKDGSVFWASATISALFDRSNNFVGYLALSSDLTGQRRGRLIVENQNEALQLVISGAPLDRIFSRLIALVEAEAAGDAIGAILLLDADKRRLVHGAAPSLPDAYNRAIDGLPIDAHLGTCAAAAARNEIVITPDLASAPGWEGLRGPALALGLRAAWSMPIVSSEGEVLGTFGTYFRRTRRPTESEIDTMAVLVKTAALAITRSQAEARLRAAIAHTERQERLYETVLASTPDFINIVDLDYRLRYANPAQLDLLGRRAPDVLGKTWAEIGTPAWLVEKHRRELDQVVATKRAVRGQVTLDLFGPGLRTFDYIFSPVIGANGEVEAITTASRDVTDEHAAALAVRQARDEALASSRAKDDFLAALSHELRTPLNPVLLIASEAMANPALTPEVRADFETIVHSVTLEARLIDDLLDVTRIAHNKMSFEPKRHELPILLQRVVGAMQPEVTQKRITLTSRIETSAIAVLTDEVRLQQVFWNLLKNAVKFTPPEGRITVTIRSSAQRAGFVAVEVSDTGIGLTEAELGRIFDPFVQGDHAGFLGRPVFGGLGLGLAISRKIVAMNGGSISACSAGRDRGASFIVELPLADADPSARPPGESSGGSLEPPLPRHPRRILLVEDHEPSRAALARLLGRRQIEVFEADSAAGALELAARQPFDLVISDLGLPDGSGYELMKLLWGRHELPGIALTGFGNETDVARSHLAGFVAHLTKPIQAVDLDRVLGEFGRRAKPSG